MFSSIRHSGLSPVLLFIAYDTQIVKHTNARLLCTQMTDSIQAAASTVSHQNHLQQLATCGCTP
jgi:hypothetical protein